MEVELHERLYSLAILSGGGNVKLAAPETGGLLTTTARPTATLSLPLLQSEHDLPTGRMLILVRTREGSAHSE